MYFLYIIIHVYVTKRAKKNLQRSDHSFRFILITDTDKAHLINSTYKDEQFSFDTCKSSLGA